MERMLERLERAMQRGLMMSMALAACSAKEVSEPMDSVEQVAGAGGEGATTPGLQSYPDDAYPTCSGPTYGQGGAPSGYDGQCCVEPMCFTPEHGACPPADQVGSAELPEFPPGSGTCGCSPVEGPFAPRKDHEAATPGSCCYLVGSIGCTGRPLLVNGSLRVAASARRSDWSSRPSWA